MKAQQLMATYLSYTIVLDNLKYYGPRTQATFGF